MTEAAFYCASSELYFPGAVGLVNSLRTAGHDEPIYLLDCGLSDRHRELIGADVTLVEGAPSVPPYLLKTVAPRLHPADVMVMIDVDMIVTRSLSPLIEQAAGNRVVAVKDNMDRFDERWGPLLDLGEAQPRPYVTSGFVVLGGPSGHELLRLWDERQDRVDYELSWFARNVDGYPFQYLDQDVLNAVLCTRIDPDRVITLEPRLAPVPPFRDLAPKYDTGLGCAYGDGTEPFLIHQFVRKPWLEPMYHSVYSELLARAWSQPGATVELSTDEIPLRMRHGTLARLERRRVDIQDLLRWYIQDVIPERVRAWRTGANATDDRR